MAARDDTPQRRRFALAALLFGCLLAFALAEIGARLAGFEPWSQVASEAKRPYIRMRDPDPVLGWRNRPGVYTLGRERATILPAGSRRSSDNPPADAPVVALIGGSFIYGQGIPDEETLAWLLQERDPSRRYLNLGVSGFGTYQSLLLLERYLERHDPPEAVVYGLIDHHRTRNIARGPWLAWITRLAVAEYPKLPYCSLDEDGQLVRHRPTAYPRMPLREHSAFLTMLEHGAMMHWSRRREQQQDRITELLLVELHELCQRRGIRLTVALLQDGERGAATWDRIALDANGIPFADCRVPLTPELRVPVDAHPNVKVQRLWADCLGDAD